MNTPNTRARWAAILAGTAATGGALYILLRPAIVSGEVAAEHILLPIIVLVTIASLHLAGIALREWRTWPSAAGFLLVALLGIGLTVYVSVGNQAKLADADAARRELAAQQRAAIEAEIAQVLERKARDEELLEAARGRFERECATGKGSRCDGRRVSVEVYEAAVSGHDATLARLRGSLPAADPAGSAEARPGRMAAAIAVLAAAPDEEEATRARLTRTFALFEPFAFSLFLELAAIVAFGYAFRHRPAQAPNGSPAQAAPDTADPSNGSPASAKDEPTPPAEPNGSGPGGGHTKDEALADLLTRMALGERFGSQDELAARWGRAKSTVSEWLKEWEADGVIPARTVRGRKKQLASA